MKHHLTRIFRTADLINKANDEWGQLTKGSYSKGRGRTT
ncbi:unnamed protein product [Toxocara canis]|uniref:Uncharacterized protein n=1 Tax=Toxocara canis TaxID=6265 RepID=A0A3P7GQ42_TOXCA|nr:unnamed protein product [Toxocara canis]